MKKAKDTRKSLGFLNTFFGFWRIVLDDCFVLSRAFLFWQDCWGDLSVFTVVFEKICGIKTNRKRI